MAVRWPSLFTTAGGLLGVVMNRNPRPPSPPSHRQMRRVLNGLFAVLIAMNLVLVFTGSATASFALVNRLMSVTPLLFLSATTFYENRFEFYDLVVKRGALLLAGVLLARRRLRRAAAVARRPAAGRRRGRGCSP